MSPGEGFDLAAYRAAEADVFDETFDVKVPIPSDNGNEPTVATIHFPPQKRWKLRAQVYAGAGDIVNFMGAVLGPDEAKILLEDADLDNGEFMAIWEALSKWSGFQMGQPALPQPVRGSTPMPRPPSSAPTGSTSTTPM